MLERYNTGGCLACEETWRRHACGMCYLCPLRCSSVDASIHLHISEHLNISTSKAMSLVQLNNPTAVKVFLEEMLNLHRGQGMDMSLALPI